MYSHLATAAKFFFHYPWLLGLIIALLGGQRLGRVMGRIESALRRLGRRPVRSAALIFVLALGYRLALLPVLGVPIPRIHDEFSYLLAADTFASGRLTNPPHPMWVHFETFHVNFQPTYHSKYPPAQGMVLGAAQALVGIPWVGVLVSTAAMCVAFCWMLCGWMSGGWALLGGLWAVAQYCGGNYWINSYWGGAVAAIGGALVLGAVPRIVKHLRMRDGLLLAIGMAILANSRPFEGLVLSIAAGIMLLARLVKRKAAMHVVVTQLLLPAGVVLVMAAAGMTYYFSRTTANPFLMPYNVNAECYQQASPFIWQKPATVRTYNHPELYEFYANWEPSSQAPTSNSLGAHAEIARTKLNGYLNFFAGPFRLLFLLGIIYLFQTKRWLVLVTISMFGTGLILERWAQAHYAAPMAALVMGILLWGTRYLRLWGRRWRLGLRWAQAMLLIIPIAACADAARAARGPFDPLDGAQRARISAQLERTPGKHLVIMRYGPRHSIHDEWVYNAADIDRAKIVWARDMSPERDQELLEYFHDRRVWLVDPTAPIVQARLIHDPSELLSASDIVQARTHRGLSAGSANQQRAAP